MTSPQKHQLYAKNLRTVKGILAAAPAGAPPPRAMQIPSTPKMVAIRPAKIVVVAGADHRNLTKPWRKVKVNSSHGEVILGRVMDVVSLAAPLEQP